MKKLPKHIAIIMDGNGRWAKRHGLPRAAGHEAGSKAVRATIEECVQQGVEVLTLFAFSQENWYRPNSEVNFLMDLFLKFLQQEMDALVKHNIRLRVIGNRHQLKPKLQQKIFEAEQLSLSHRQLTVVVALNYSGHWDIITATQKLAAQVLEGKIAIDSIDPQLFQQQLSTADLPEPDLLIRTSGEQRISNFMLWQLAYTELFFTDVLWPDFDASVLQSAIEAFNQRERRFGKTSEQIKQACGA